MGFRQTSVQHWADHFRDTFSTAQCIPGGLDPPQKCTCTVCAQNLCGFSPLSPAQPTWDAGKSVFIWISQKHLDWIMQDVCLNWSFGFCYLPEWVWYFFSRLYTSGFLQLKKKFSFVNSFKDLKTSTFSFRSVEKILGSISWIGKSTCT